MSRRATVAVAMSGGVDSSMAAALLCQEGFDVLGVTLQLWPKDLALQDFDRHHGCCSLDAVEDARRVAGRLRIPYYVFNFEEDFRRTVIGSFAQAYLAGRTPNPCIACNEHVKFGLLLQKALALGCDYVATGHYARIDGDARTGFKLLKSRDEGKDQSYVLYQLGQRELARLKFPVGSLTKSEIRAHARELGLVTADKPESQDLCFLAGGSYRDYLRDHFGERIRPGAVEDAGGAVVGRHEGVALYTVGQRSGLRLENRGPHAPPAYVTAIDAQRNVIKVGDLKALGTDGCRATDVRFTAGAPPTSRFRATVKVRSRAPEVPAAVEVHEQGATVRFDQPQRGVAPGQAIVFYQDEVVLGGGVID